MVRVNPKLGSLFDGSGGFPLAGAMFGIEPVWASEVEPYPIAVTRERFPNMKHLGDISKINGAEIEPVDIITFGSPCQDLSVAGKRAGLKHESNGDEETTRSGLFMEAVRIIKEMRDATNGVYPRFAVWENVPGAFSSNKGEDFRIVLEELIKIAEPDAVMPAVPEKGWAYADHYSGDGWSLAYRVFDAQYWGVPQRRRRIHLVADFGDQCAGEVLFKFDCLRGYFAEGRAPWQGIAPYAQGGSGATDREAISFEPGIAAREGGHIYEGVSGTLRANAGDNQLSVAYSSENHPADSRVNIDESGKVQCLTSRMGTGGGNVPMVMEPVYCLQGNGIDRADTAGCNGKGVKEDICYTLNTIDRPAVAYVVDQGGGKSSCSVTENLSPTLCTTHAGEPAVVYALDRASFNQGANAKYDFEITDSGIASTLVAKGPRAVAFETYQKVTGPLMANSHPGSYTGQDAFSDMLIAGDEKTQYIVRRLTPTECARLQGFPDYWGHFPEKDSMTDEEYRFWLDVRNTHARVNGKAEKDYTKDQMLTWYNKLHTDSAEYKMWGNGIALPPALYVMQGIVDVLTREDQR